MKKFLNLCLALCLLCGLNGVHSVSAEEGQAGDDEIIKCNEQGIPDPALYAAVLNAGDSNQDGILTKAEAEGIEKLTATDGEIENLKGIENLINLTELNLRKTNITSLKDIENLSKLTQLYLDETKITSLQGIEKLTNLTILGLDETKITSLQGIENLRSLTNLSLMCTGITSLEGVENLTNLTDLNLDFTRITSLQGIEKLTKLTSLHLDCAGITSIEGIEKLTKLTSLHLSSEGITSIEGIENLTNLTDLSLRFTGITSLKGIENLTNLTRLDLYETKITSLKGIENLTNLTYLDLEGINIADLQGIENLTNLTDLIIRYNNLSVLPDLTKLVNLDASNMGWLERKFVDGNNIMTEEFLAKLPKQITDKIRSKEIVINQNELNLKVNEPIYYFDSCLLFPSDSECRNFVDDRELKIGLKDNQGNIDYNNKFFTDTDDMNIVMIGEVVDRNEYSCLVNKNHKDFEAFDKGMKEYWSTSNSKYLGGENIHDLAWYIVEKYNLSDSILDYNTSSCGVGSAGSRYKFAVVPIRAGSTYVTFRNGFYAIKVKVNVVDDTDDNTADIPNDDNNVDKPSVDENKPKHEYVNSDNGIPTNTSDKLRDDNVLGMTINMPNSDTATSDIFQALKETGKNLTFNVIGENDRTKYSWTFEGNEIENPDMDLDLSINFETEKQQEIQNITNQSNMFYVSFVHHGELPGKAWVKVDVSDKFKDGDYIYLYYYNEEKGTIERKGHGYEVKDGYAEFEIDHCSVYFFTKEPVKTDSKKDSNMIKNTATDGSQSNASAIILAVMVLGLLGFVVIKNKATE